MRKLNCIKGRGVEVLSGLCAGIAYFFTLPTWLIRVLVFWSFFVTGGTTLFVYVIMALCIPDAPEFPEDYFDVSG